MFPFINEISKIVKKMKLENKAANLGLQVAGGKN